MLLHSFILFVILIFNDIGAEDVGDACEPTSNIPHGTCVFATNCELALRYIKQRESHPFYRCGFIGEMEIVCCPRKLNPVVTRKTTTTTEKTVQRVGTKDSERIADQFCKKTIEVTLPPLNVHIIGGEEAQPGEFPHMAALGYTLGDGYNFSCGGSLISQEYVLTAAHCIENIQGLTPSIVRLGVVEIGKDVFNPESDIRIANIIVHPDRKPVVKYHDIALIRLQRKVEYSALLNPACLYTKDDVPRDALTITGWGKSSVNKDIRSPVLQKANVTAVSREECSAGYANWRRLPSGIGNGQLCAGDSHGLTDTCQGDSGGPLQAITARDGHYRVIGVTSFGRGCGSTVPGVYTQVSAYLDWIEGIVWPNGV
ncbi:serine protease persephone-like isoform X2 [Epargyreus clarus]|uniref:serine protease persephone-like isoform X2 n=1 Tax=Epargyreus clarus TaxID=520877 RepID=UPI003C2DB6CB